MKTRKFAGVLAVLFASAVEVAFAHGGVYAGPRKWDPAYRGPRGDSRPSGGDGGAASRALTPKKPVDQTLDWNYWWEFNDAVFLDLTMVLRRSKEARSVHDAVIGDGEEPVTAPVTSTQVRDVILPALTLGLTDVYFDAKAAALIALGKICPSGRDGPSSKMRSFLGDYAMRSVPESACLAMGILGDAASVPVLLGVYRNDEAYRREGRDLPTRLRSIAAYAIGLIFSRNGDDPDPQIVAELVKGATTPQSEEDLQISAAMALGIMKAHAAAPDLRKLAADVKQREKVRAHTVIALGKLGDRDSAPFLVKEGLTDGSVQVQRSSAIALGLLADRDGEPTVEALIATAKGASDRAVRNFAIMALGEIGSTVGRDFLVSLVSDDRDAFDRTFGALACGVYGFRSRSAMPEIGKLIFEKFKATNDESERGAFATALGLLDYGDALDALTDELKGAASPDLKGYVCLACGLLSVKKPETVKLIRELVKQRRNLDVQRRAALALGLCEDPEAVGVLCRVIESGSENLSASGAAATALSFIGDRRAVPILVKMLENKDGNTRDNARAFAAVALGMMGDKDMFCVLTKIQLDSNYLALTEATAELMLIY